MMAAAALCLLLAFFSITLADDCKCGVENIRTRIINGHESKPYTYPWVVYVKQEIGIYASTCTGSIISPNFVLTAAHCVPNDFNARVMTVYTWQGCGTSNLLKGPSYKVKKITRHPKFEWKMGDGYDAALLQLVRPVSTKNDSMPICLTKSTTGFEESIVAGWGMKSNGYFKVDSDCLNEAEIDISSKSECVRAFPTSVLDRVMCAGGETGVCQGDSGGPLMSRKNGLLFQTGIASHTRTDCGIATKSPGVFERVYHHVDWIKQVTGDDGVCVI